MLKSHEKNVNIIFQCSEMSPKSEIWKDGYCVLHRKNDWVWWGIFKEYLQQNIITEKQVLIQLSFVDW